VRDQVIDFIHYWRDRTEIAAKRITRWIAIAESKYFDWQQRYGRVNEHNSWIPRDHWLAEWEKQAIVNAAQQFPGEGYRRLTFMMMDADIVAVSPASVYRVLKEAGLMGKRNTTPSRKGRGFDQPDAAHQHWHIDISYINICGTFYYLCSILDGFSRFIVHWDLKKSMTERDVEIILQGARELFPGVRPRIISDNGPQFIARDFKDFIRICGMTHVKTSPYYPQSNGKLERWHLSLKAECIRTKTPLSLEDGKRIVQQYVEYYNNRRLHSAIGYIAPKDKLEGRAELIFKFRDEKLADARTRRQLKRQAAWQQAHIPRVADNQPNL
jgi:putative transposase